MTAPMNLNLSTSPYTAQYTIAARLRAPHPTDEVAERLAFAIRRACTARQDPDRVAADLLAAIGDYTTAQQHDLIEHFTGEAERNPPLLAFGAEGGVRA